MRRVVRLGARFVLSLGKTAPGVTEVAGCGGLVYISHPSLAW